MNLEDFLSIFTPQNNKPNSFTDFVKMSKVKIKTNTIPLDDYITKKNINMNDIKILFENIQKRNEYLTRFYNTSLRYPQDISIKKPPMTNKMNNNSLVNYKNIIRNMFFWDILKNTKSGIENIPTYMDVLEDLYLKNIIDYKILTPSSLYYMKEGRLGSVFSSYYFRASILNPYLIYSLNKSVLHGKRIFTPTLGWCSYYYGFAESGIETYVGIDVIPSVCDKVKEFANKYYSNINTEIICSPSEKMLTNKLFINKWKGKFDTVFFSPPYFKLELYHGGEQSTENYPNYEEWLKEYWEKTIQLSNKMLEKGGTLCYILSGYGSQNIKEEYDLINDMNKITEKYFKLKEIQPMYNKNVHVTMHKEPSEKIMIYKKT
jgi:hypothetical protein